MTTRALEIVNTFVFSVLRIEILSLLIINMLKIVPMAYDACLQC